MNAIRLTPDEQREFDQLRARLSQEHEPRFMRREKHAGGKHLVSPATLQQDFGLDVSPLAFLKAIQQTATYSKAVLRCGTLALLHADDIFKLADLLSNRKPSTPASSASRVAAPTAPAELTGLALTVALFRDESASPKKRAGKAPSTAPTTTSPPPPAKLTGLAATTAIFAAQSAAKTKKQ